MKRKVIFSLLVLIISSMIAGVFMMSRKTIKSTEYVFPKANTIDGVRYELTVPAECVYSDDVDMYYIIVIEKISNYWLKADAESKKYVTVPASNDWFCAVEGDGICMNTMIKK